MNGNELARQLIKQYGTTDVEELARRAGVTVRYQRWMPVTYGEYYPKSRTICVNLNAPIPPQEVLAHELGHFFADVNGYKLNRTAHEQFAEAFALAFTAQIPAP